MTIFLILGMMACAPSEPIKLEITYTDGSKEILITREYFKTGGITILRAGCTVNIYDNSRCGVRSVKVLN